MNQGLTDRVASHVRAELARQRITQTKLGEKLGISQQQVSARLNGRIAFDTGELETVAEFLGVPVATFIAETHPGPTHPTPTGPSQPPAPSRVAAA